MRAVACLVLAVGLAATTASGCSKPVPKGTCSAPIVVPALERTDETSAMLALQRVFAAELRACLRSAVYCLAHGQESVSETVDAVLGACADEAQLFRTNNTSRYYGITYDATIPQQLAVEAALDREARQIATFRVIEARQGDCRQ